MIPVTVKQIARMRHDKAEKAIEAIADKKGDALARQLLAELSPVAIAAILRQHDFSCPSMISWLLTPDRIQAVLRVDPLFWRDVCDVHRPYFSDIQRQALELILTFLLTREDRAYQAKILRRIDEDSISQGYLELAFVGWQIQKNQTMELEDPAVEYGSQDHLFEIIRWAAPDTAQRLMEMSYPRLFHSVTDLWSEAVEALKTDAAYARVEAAMFTPLPDRSPL